MSSSINGIPKGSTMFTEQFIFTPENTINDDELLSFTIFILRSILLKYDEKGDAHPFKEPNGLDNIEKLRNLLHDMKISLNHEKFESLPDSLKKQFMVMDRNKNNYRYGRKIRT